MIDAECQRGLQQLRELLSHVDPHLTVGQLVGRLVREGVERYDPSRPPRRKRRKSDPASDECSAETAGQETTDRVVAAAENPRRAEKSAVPTTLSAPKRSAKPTAVGTSPAVLPAHGGAGGAAPKRRLGPPPGSPTSAPKCVAPRAERAGSADGALATEPTSARRPAWQPAVRFRSRALTARDRRDGHRRRSLARLPAARLRTVAPAARDRRSGLRRRSPRSPVSRPADRFRRRFDERSGNAIRVAAATSTGIPGGAAAHASSWSWTTSFRSRGAVLRSRQT